MRFIKEYIPSLWALRLLLLMRRPPVRTWSPGELVRELRASDLIVTGVLSRFEDQGVVVRECDQRYRFAVGTGLDELCEALADVYSVRPIAVQRVIISPEDKLIELADAFRIRDSRE